MKEGTGQRIANIKLKLKESYRRQAQEELNSINEIETQNISFLMPDLWQKTASSIGPLLRRDGTYTDETKEMSEMLKALYDSVFSEPLTRLRVNSLNDFL